MALPLVTAAGAPRACRRKAWRAAIIGLVVAGAAALVAFALCDPYALLRPGFFRSEVEHLSHYTSGNLLLGETQRSGYRYYAWSLLWAFGVLPLALAAVGAVRIALRERVQAALLLPAVVIFLLVIGSQGRYFARYAMPIYPLLALIAAAGGVWLAREAARRVPALRRHARVAIPLAIALVCAQGLVLSIHNDRVLAREDTRSTAREWLDRNLAPGTKVAVEPLVPAEWYEGTRWERFRRTGEDARELAREFPGAARRADFANYGFTLFPGYIDFLRERGRVLGRVRLDAVRARRSTTRGACRRRSATTARSSARRTCASPPRRTRGPSTTSSTTSRSTTPRCATSGPGPAMRIYQLRDCRSSGCRRSRGRAPATRCRPAASRGRAGSAPRARRPRRGRRAARSA